MSHDPCVTEAIRRLDTMETTAADWEIGFLESLLHQSSCSDRQRAVLIRMVEQYLPADGLAEELAGQARLPGMEDGTCPGL